MFATSSRPGLVLPLVANPPLYRLVLVEAKELLLRHTLLVVAAAVNSTGISIDPASSGDLPGGGTLASLASGVGHWALLASIVGVIVGGVMWAFGHFAHNYQQSYNGRRGVVVSGVAALLIGGSQEIISFFFTQGLNLH